LYFHNAPLNEIVLHGGSAMAMKIAICDDDKKCTDKLEVMIKSYTNRNEIEKYDIIKFSSGTALVDKYVVGNFDIIFLDVQMPGIDGFETAKKIREVDLDADIVFVTYLKDDVQKGFDYNAKGYLYKDVTQAQIDERMDKLIAERLRNATTAFYQVKLKKGGTVLLSLPRVLYFESYSHDISAVMENETLVFIDTITNLTKQLESKGFIRISQSFLVNIAHVFNVTGNQVTIVRGKDLTIGRAYKQALIDAISKREVNKWKI